MRRLPTGGHIDRTQLLTFRWNDRPMTGYRGDTIASALLASDVAVTGHSLHRGRPRGTVSHGWDEPNSLVSIRGVGSRSLAWATTTELVDGMEVAPWGGRTDLASPDARQYVVRNRHTDLLVIGAGEVGRVAATAAARAGRSVLLLDDDVRDPSLDRALAGAYLHHTRAVFAEPDGLVAALDYRGDAHTLWRIRAGEVLTATGTMERPLVFPGNDLPGVMLARSVATYLHRYAILAGDSVVIAAANHTGVELAVDLAAAGAHVTVVLAGDRIAATEHLASADIDALSGRLVAAHGTDRVTSAVVVDSTGLEHTLECDLIAVSGGFDARDHLEKHSVSGLRVQLGKTIVPVPCPHRQPSTCTCFVDQHRDVTAADLSGGVAAGLRSVEHLKRFTTLGTGADQGRLAAVPAAQVLSDLLGVPPELIGTSVRRPPASPVPLGALAGARSSATSRPVHRGPLLDEWRVLGWNLRVENSWVVGARGGSPTGVAPDTWVTDLTGVETCILHGPDAGKVIDLVAGLLVVGNRSRVGLGRAGTVDVVAEVSDVAGRPAVVGRALQHNSLHEWITERIRELAPTARCAVVDISDGLVTLLHHGSSTVPIHLIESTGSSTGDPTGTRRMLVRRSLAVAVWQHLIAAGCKPLGHDEFQAVRARAGLPSEGREITVGSPPNLPGLVQLTACETGIGPVAGSLVLNREAAPVGHVTSVAHGDSVLPWVGLARIDGGKSLGETAVVLHDGRHFDAQVRAKEHECTN